MPIASQYKFSILDESRFKEIDYEVMGAAYRIHNDLGCLFHEKIYKQELAGILRATMTCDLEVAVNVSYQEFFKPFYIDAVVQQGLICEFKVASQITAEHEAQLLQYMLLTGVSRGKVINFGGQSVEGKLISTQLTQDLRRKLVFNFDQWSPACHASNKFCRTVTELLQDLGGFLSVVLYYEAITCLLGGHENVVKTVALRGRHTPIAQQRCHLLDFSTAFKITAITSKDRCSSYRRQLKKFLVSTNLTAIEWVNLDHHNVSFETIK